MQAVAVLRGAAGEGSPEIDVGGLADVAEPAQAPHVCQVATLGGSEEIPRLPAVHLGRGLQEQDRIDDQAREREPGVVDAVLAAHQVLGHERAVGPGHHVVVHLVDLAERRPHLPDLQQQVGGQRRERDEALLHADRVRREGQEEVGPRVRVHDGLEGRLCLVQLEGGRGEARVVLADSPGKLVCHLRATYSVQA